MTTIRRSLRVLSSALFINALVGSFDVSRAQGTREPERKQARPSKARPPSESAGRFTSADGGQTVHDSLLKVTWLLDANVGKSQCKKVAGVGDGGGMNWNAAWACVAQLNGGEGLLGHTNWQMPATPKSDPGCGGKGGHQNSFGENCSASSYGSLFYLAWKLHYGQTVALETGPVRGGFRNLQPTLYWYGNKTKVDSSKKDKNGYNSFSFGNGWQGANVDHHAMYVLPMIPGQVDKNSVAGKATIFDRTGDPGVAEKTGITWLADANAASDPAFLQAVKATGLSINQDGSMDQATAAQLVGLMRTNKYLERSDWMLPLANTTNCQINAKTGTTGGYDCNVSGMGHLYYDVFKLVSGSAVAEPADIEGVKPFSNVQPSLYWACMARSTTVNARSSNLCADTTTAAPGFGFSFDMGNGFTDTTLLPSDLYLMVYYPDPARKK